MGIKVKAKVQFSKIIENLHKSAKENAEKSDTTIKLENTAFNDQNGEFIGKKGGQFIIFVKSTNKEPVTEDDKERFLKFIRTYVYFFVSEGDSLNVKAEHLCPIYEGSVADKEEMDEIDKKEKEKKEREEKAKQEEEQTKQKAKENYGTSGKNTPVLNKESQETYHEEDKLIRLLFEADSDTTPPPKPEEAKGDAQPTDNEDQEKQTKCMGYGMKYSINVNGKVQWNITDSISNKTKGFFGGMLADLRNIKIKIGGEMVNFGHIFDPQKWKELIGLKDIDKDQVAQDVKTAMDHEKGFPGNKATVSCVPTKQLSLLLQQYGVASPEAFDSMARGQSGQSFIQKGLSFFTQKLKLCKYAILIQSGQEDIWHYKYTRKKLAPVVSRAFGTTKNAVDTNAVGEKDIIKLDNVQRVTISKSATNQKEKDKPFAQRIGQMLKNYEQETDGKNGTENDNKKGQKKDVKESVISETDDVPKYDVNGNKNEEEKKDPKLELVQSEEYLNYVKEQTEEQHNKVLRGLGESVETKYMSNEDCVKLLQDKNVNNTEFVNQIRDTKENCVVTTITKDLSKLKSNNESVDIIRELLHKYDTEHGLITEATENNDENENTETAKIVNYTVKYISKHQHPFRSKEEDAEYQEDVCGMADSQELIEKISQKLQTKVTIPYKNIFLNTKSKFDTLKEVYPSFKMFQTNVELQKMDESAVYGSDGILQILFEERRKVERGTKGDSNNYIDETDDNKQIIKLSHEFNDSVAKMLYKGSKKQKEKVEQPKEVEKAQSTPSGEETSVENSMGVHTQMKPYCVMTYTELVIDYMSRHNIGNDEVYSKMRGNGSTSSEPKQDEKGGDAQVKENMTEDQASKLIEKNQKNKYKYCAILIKKLSYKDKDGHVIYRGGLGHDGITDQGVNGVFDKVFGNLGDNLKIPMIHCTDQNKDTMTKTADEIIDMPLDFHNNGQVADKIPELDVWIRAFNVEDKKEPESGNGDTSTTNITNNDNRSYTYINNDNRSINNVNLFIIGGGSGGTPVIPVNINIKMLFIFIMPDPISIKIKEKTPPPGPKPKPGEGGGQNNDTVSRVDWYIIPHRQIKDMGGRHMQRSTDGNGVTTTKTSDAEYKPDNNFW